MLFSFAIIFIGAYLFGSLFNRIKLPEIIGYIVCGIIIGPFCLSLLSDDLLEIAPILRQLSLVIILARAGLSLDIKELKGLGRPALLLCILPAICEIFGITILAPIFFPLNYSESFLLGCVIAAVSPAIIVPRMLYLKEHRYGAQGKIPELITFAASLDDIFVIVAFAGALEWVKTGTFNSQLLINIPLSIINGIILGVVVGIIICFLFSNYILALIQQVIILLSVLFIFLYLEDFFAHIIPISALLSIMCCGITINYKAPSISKSLGLLLKDLWIPAQIWLFVLVGALLDLSLLVVVGIMGILLIFIGLVFRSFGVGMSLCNTSFVFREKLFIFVSYLPKATVQAAIGSVALNYGLNCGEFVQTLSVVAIVVTAPLGAILMDYLYPILLKKDKI